MIFLALLRNLTTDMVYAKMNMFKLCDVLCGLNGKREVTCRAYVADH